MNNKADRIALRAILGLIATIALVLVVNNFASSVEWSDFAPKFSVPTLPVSRAVATPVPARLIAPKLAPLEPEIRRATPVLPPPVMAEFAPIAAEMTVEVMPKRWSKLIQVPIGRSPSVSFSLGRIRIQRNGVDLGVFYRHSMIEGEQVGPRSYNFRVLPWAMLDRSPKIMDFDSETRTLRFLSMEKTSGDVLVEFREQ